MSQTGTRIAALVAVMAAIPFAHMLDLGYAPLNPEPWIVTALFALAGLLLGWLVAPRRSFAAVYAFVIYWFVDANIYDGGWLLAVPSLVVIFGLGLFMARIESWALPVTAVFAVMFSITAVVKTQPAPIEWRGAIPAADPAAPRRSARCRLRLGESCLCTRILLGTRAQA